MYLQEPESIVSREIISAIGRQRSYEHKNKLFSFFVIKSPMLFAKRCVVF